MTCIHDPGGRKATDHAALGIYDLWRVAYVRGLVTAAEFVRFLVGHDRRMAELLCSPPALLIPQENRS